LLKPLPTGPASANDFAGQVLRQDLVDRANLQSIPSIQLPGGVGNLLELERTVLAQNGENF